MENFDFYSPTYFVFGKGAEEKTGAMVKRYGGTKVLIHYGGGSVIRSGLLDRIKKSLDAEGISYIELGGAKPNPLSGLVYEGIELARKEKVDFVLGVGGGSSVDSAKAIAFGTLYDGDFWDFYCGKKGPVTESLPIGCVMTLAATGTEGSTDTVITNENGMHKRCADGDILRPLFAIMNPELTTTLPEYQTASGISDIFSHCMERYFSHTKDVELTDRMLEAVMLTLIKEAKIVIADPADYQARANIMWAATIAHNNVTGVGRAQDWGTHHMENELSTTYGCSHGAGLGILHTYWMKYVLDKVDGGLDRLVQFAVRVWGCQMDYENPRATALEGIDCYTRFIKSMNLPTTIGEIGGKPEDAPKLAEGMFFEAPNHGNFLKLTPEIAEEIYRMAM